MAARGQKVIAELEPTRYCDHDGDYFRVRIVRADAPREDRGYWDRFRPDVRRLEVHSPSYLAAAVQARVDALTTSAD